MPLKFFNSIKIFSNNKKNPRENLRHYLPLGSLQLFNQPRDFPLKKYEENGKENSSTQDDGFRVIPIKILGNMKSKKHLQLMLESLRF